MATLIPIIAFCFWIGLYPSPFLRAMEVSVANVIQTVEKGDAGKPVQGKRAANQSGSRAIERLGNQAGPIAQLSNRPNDSPHEGIR
jgi:hypothetical protein